MKVIHEYLPLLDPILWRLGGGGRKKKERKNQKKKISNDPIRHSRPTNGMPNEDIHALDA